MNDFKNMVSRLAQLGENRLFLNSSEEHAVVVLSEMFKVAESNIRIFAGCLYEHVGNSPEYIQALSDFIERGGSVKILLNNFNPQEGAKSNLFKRLAYYQELGKSVEIRSTDAKPYLANDEAKKEVHFTIADERAYRIETDIKERTAACNFDGETLAKKFATFFDNIFSEATEIKLNEI
ncbi:MAG: hypothetical protein HDS21_03235 [Bacteroides sp.]|nr:hypothetical protein [Bacteroides sp.]